MALLNNYDVFCPACTGTKEGVAVIGVTLVKDNWSFLAAHAIGIVHSIIHFGETGQNKLKHYCSVWTSRKK